MTRFVSILVAVVGLAGACGKDAPSAEQRAAAPPAVVPGERAPSAPAPVPPPRERVRPTGVLDLELATRGDRHTVRNATFEVTFPGRPVVQAQRDAAPSGEQVTSALAVAQHRGDQLAFAVTPMPAGPYDPVAGINGARDGAIRNVGAKLVAEVDTTIGGLAAKKVTATAKQGSQTVYLEMHLAWDAAHHQLYTLLTASPQAMPSQAARDFVGSLEVKAAAPAAAAAK